MNVIGRKPVLELLESGKPVKRVCVALGTQGRIVGEIIALAKQRKIRVDRIPQQRVKREFGNGNHQGVMAEVSPVKLYDLGDLYSDQVPVKYNLMMALDGVSDPFHLGAIARSALGAGCDAIILPARKSAPITDVVIKSSAGAVMRIPLIQVSNLGNALTNLKKDDWWVVGAAGEGSNNLWEQEWKGKNIIVMGSEGKGLGQRTRDLCDQLISIPLDNKLESLSVSASAAVLLFDVSRKRCQE